MIGSAKAETSSEKTREFNVATSRAMEQMILFHSPDLPDLRPDCLKHKLLEYCLNPGVSQLPSVGLSLDELREISHATDRVLGNQPPPFESWFEVDVNIFQSKNDTQPR